MFYSFQCTRFVLPSVKFTPTHFILFYAIVNGIVFFVSFLDCSLLMCRNSADFYLLTFYLPTLLNSFILKISCIIFMIFYI